MKADTLQRKLEDLRTRIRRIEAILDESEPCIACQQAMKVADGRLKAGQRKLQ